MTDRTILHDLLDHARRAPDRLAFEVGGERITRAGLRDGALQTAAALAARGIGAGTHCALLLPTCGDLFRILLALQFLRAVPCVLNPAMPAQALLRRVLQMDMRCVVGLAETLTPLGAQAGANGLHFIEAPDLAWRGFDPLGDFQLPVPGDVSHFQLTSGSTGEPRAAVILHRGVHNCTKVWTEQFKVDPLSDVIVAWVPLHHDLGLIRCFMQVLQSGCACHSLEASIRNFRPWLETISRVRGTITGGPDFAFRIAARIVKPDGLDLSSLRIATNGAEPVRMSTLDVFEKTFGLGHVVMPGYGMAEMTVGITMMRPGEARRVDAGGAVACGRPYPNIEVRILSEQGQELPPNTPGEIVVAGTPVFAGYYNDPVSTAAVLREGWVHTGDMGKLDEDGFLYVLGRKRAMIKRAGALIAPREIEEAVDQITAVRFCAAVGFVREELGGTEDVAVVVEARAEDLPGEAARAALRSEISAAVARSMGVRPARVVLVEPRTIPRTGNGKIKYMELKASLASGALEQRIL